MWYLGSGRACRQNRLIPGGKSLERDVEVDLFIGCDGWHDGHRGLCAFLELLNFGGGKADAGHTAYLGAKGKGVKLAFAGINHDGDIGGQQGFKRCYNGSARSRLAPRRQAKKAELGNRVAIYVDMKSGRQLRTGTDHALTVLCIRTDDPLTKDMWADEKGSLMWRYLPGFVDWGTADRLCRNLARVDRMPWRLPTMSEIDLAHKHGIQGETNSSFGRDFLSYIWSSEVETAYGSEAYAHDLRTGNHFLMTRDTKLQNLCVRPQNY